MVPGPKESTVSVTPYSWTVREESHGADIGTFVQQQLSLEPNGGISLSKKAIKRLVDEGACTVNGRIIRKTNISVAEGDTVRLYFRQKKTEGSIMDSFQLLYEDEWMLAISKPAYISTEESSVRKLLLRANVIHEKSPIFLVHRLDRNTTGVLLVAKTEEVKRLLEEKFKKRTMEKVYIAIVDGELPQKEGTIQFPLMREKGTMSGKASMRVARPGDRTALTAETYWRCLIAKNRTSLVAVYPKTGRTHQIRVHMAAIGHSLVGDSSYTVCHRDIPVFPGRHMLHALRLSFSHPVTQKEIIVYDSLPKDFKSCVQHLFGPAGEKMICEL